MRHWLATHPPGLTMTAHHGYYLSLNARARAIVGVVDDPDASDGFDTPGWMRLVADSEITARAFTKARKNGGQLREARASADPRSVTFTNGMRDRADQAKERWQPGVTWEWWTTASRSSALAAYIAALESSGIDEQAAVAADQFRAWFTTRPNDVQSP